MSIEGEPPYRPEEPQKQEESKSSKELLRLLHDYEEAGRDIEERGITTLEALDRYLKGGLEWKRADLRNWRQSFGEANTPIEYMGKEIVTFLKAEKGSYAREKADYCMKRGQWQKESGDDYEQDTTLSEELRKRGAQEWRQKAVHWFRMTAVCLEAEKTP